MSCSNKILRENGKVKEEKKRLVVSSEGRCENDVCALDRQEEMSV